MKANELRIGNRLCKDGIIVTIDGRSIFDIWSSDISSTLAHPYEPIPLTEEWLLRMGFEKIEDSPFDSISLKYWVKNGLCLFFNEAPPYNTYLIGYADHRFSKYTVVTSRWVDAVHTIQNAYFVFTGTELEIKIDTIKL